MNKAKVTLILLAGISCLMSAQQDSSSIAEKAKEEFRVVEVMPRFYHPDCEAFETQSEKKVCSEKKMLEYIYRNLRYPQVARDIGKEGTIVVRFVVDDLGYLKDFQIVRSLGYGLDEEALRVVKGFPQPWEPGMNNGVPVSVYFNLPIKYRLE